VLEDSIIKSGSYNINQGVGVRAVSGEKSGFAYSDEISMDALLASAKSASAISKAGQNGRVKSWQRQDSYKALYTSDNPLDNLTEVEKIELLRLADTTARASSPYVEQVIANVVAVHETILVADLNGNLSADVRPLVRMSVTVIIEKDGKRESAGSGGGGRFGLNFFTEANRIKGYVEEAVRQALIKLEAVDAPMGEQVVVLGNGWPGVLLHEAVGHGLEGDFNRKGTSAFSGRIGEQVASKGVTVVDPQEILSSVKNGLYAVNFGGGQVDITSGKFVFSASEAYLIEDGKVTSPVKGATLIGNGPDIMNRISMIGNDLELDSGVGVCGKAGQSVPVGVGQPTLRVDGLTVGGTAG